MKKNWEKPLVTSKEFNTDFLKWEISREISGKHEDETLCSAQ